MFRCIAKFIAVYLILLCSALIYALGEAKAEENWLIQPDELSLNYRQYRPSSRHPLFHDSTMKEGIDLKLNTNLMFETVFFDNLIHSNTNDAQYYHIGWHFQLGVRVFSFLTLQYEHHSQHVLDNTYPHMKFPVEDSLGFTLTIYQHRPRGRSLTGF